MALRRSRGVCAVRRRLPYGEIGPRPSSRDEGRRAAVGDEVAREVEITDEMRQAIGRPSRPWTLEVTTTSIRAFARGVGYRDPVYFDVEAARRAGYRTLPVPPTYLGTPVFLPGRSDDTFSAPREGRPALRHGLKGLLDGGTETEYFDTIYAGDTLTIVSRIASLDVRTSPTLGKMLIVTTESTYTNQDGDIVARQAGRQIYY
jgi:acyl dehydratase